MNVNNVRTNIYNHVHVNPLASFADTRARDRVLLTRCEQHMCSTYRLTVIGLIL